MANLSEDDVRKISPSWAGAIDKWSKLSKLIFSENKEIPIKQMAIKAKHEQQIYDEINNNFANGKSIGELRYKL